MTINDKLKWNEHLVDSKVSLNKQINTRINAIKTLRKHMDMKTLTKISTGLVSSKILYRIEIWGVAPDYLTKTIQTTQ